MREERTLQTSAPSLEALASQFPSLLARLHDVPPPISHACVSLSPDQRMPASDVVAFHRALTAQHVRHVGLVEGLVDDPRRFGRITLDAQRRGELLQQMRNLAVERGFEFSQLSWDADYRFQILGDGVAITANQEASRGVFSVELELSPQLNGALPTEPMMERLLEEFRIAVERVDGAKLSIEHTSLK